MFPYVGRPLVDSTKWTKSSYKGVDNNHNGVTTWYQRVKDDAKKQWKQQSTHVTDNFELHD